MYLSYDIQTLLLQTEPARAEAVQHILNLVYSAPNQFTRFDSETAISNFLSILSSMASVGMSMAFDSLSIPLIFPESIQVRAQQNIGEEQVSRWAVVVPTPSVCSETGLDRLERCDLPVSKETLRARVFVNQTLALCLTLQNPLRESLSIQQVSLNVSCAEALEVSPLQCDLQPLEIKTITLFIKLKIPTTFEIEGITFYISPTISFTHALTLPKQRLNHTLQQRRQAVYAPPQKLILTVSPIDCAIQYRVNKMECLTRRLKGSRRSTSFQNWFRWIY